MVSCWWLLVLLLVDFFLIRVSSSYDRDHRRTTLQQNDDYKPHILVVVMDDLGSKDLGIHGSGIQTPVADQLIKRGLYLNNFYTHPQCSPSRIALMTGRLPYRMGVYRAFNYTNEVGVSNQNATLATVVRSAGYQAHAVGKWHIGGGKPGQNPTQVGFQSYYGCLANVHDYYNHTFFDGLYEMRRERHENCGPGCVEWPDDRGVYNTHVLEREAKKVVEQHNKTNGPLFLYLSFNAVHTPLQVPKEYLKPYRRKNWDFTYKVYAGMLDAADQALGRVIRTYKNRGMWQDTLVIYVTDNGGASPSCTLANGKKECGIKSSNGIRRGYKGAIYEGGIRGDGFLSGPALKKLGIPIGRTSEHLFHIVDWLPTIAAIVKSIPDVNYKLDGFNQLPAIQGGKAVRNTLFLGYSSLVKGCATSEACQSWRKQMAAIRWKDFKLVRHFDMKTFELYDLSTDPGESRDIAKKRPKLFRLLAKKMQWYDLNRNAPWTAKHCKLPEPPLETDWNQIVFQTNCTEVYDRYS